MPNLLIYIGLAITLILAASLFWFFGIKAFAHVSKLERRIGRSLLQFARENDYLCMNQVCLKVDDFFITIPALLIGNKYFYYIDPLDVRGSISGKDIDKKWVLTTGKEKVHFDNPIKKSDYIIEYLVGFLKLELSDFINICVVTKEASIDHFDVTRNNAAVVGESNLLRFIKTSEKEAKVNVYRSEDIEYITSQLYEKHLQSLQIKKQMKTKKKQGD